MQTESPKTHKQLINAIDGLKPHMDAGKLSSRMMSTVMYSISNARRKILRCSPIQLLNPMRTVTIVQPGILHERILVSRSEGLAQSAVISSHVASSCGPRIL